MIFSSTPLDGVFVIEIEPHGDERGFFARTFCSEEFERHGLETDVVQCSLSFTTGLGTLRGLHLQHAPHGEAKLVRCVSGEVHDVVVDLRPASPTYLKHVGVELSGGNRRAVYVPRGCAHGFQTLTNEAEMSYQISTPFVPDAQWGVRWNDPAFGIVWPIADPTMNDRDRSYPDYAA